MMDLFRISRRQAIVTAILFLVALLLFLPMRTALSLADSDRIGLSARDVRGSIWQGRIDSLAIGRLHLGSLRAGLSPLHLLAGTARIDLERPSTAGDHAEGALLFGLGGRGVADFTGNLSLGTLVAPLPINMLEMHDVGFRFSGETCVSAEGQVRARLSVTVPGMNLAQGLSGTPRCDGRAVLFPLVSQSGMEKLNLRLFGDGEFSAEMLAAVTDPDLGQTLARAGFAQSGDGFRLAVERR